MRRMALISVAVLVVVAVAGSAALLMGNRSSQPTQAPPALAATIPDRPVAYLEDREAPPAGNVVNEVNEDPLPELPPQPDIEYPNLGYALDQKVAQQQQDDSSGARSAGESDFVSDTTSPIPVVIHLSENVDGVVAFLEENGGDPRNTGDDYIEAYVPVSLLGELSEQPGVFRVRELIPAHTR